MKKITIVLFACITGFYANAQKLQEAQVPVAVVKAFKAQYPMAKEVKWEKEAEDFEADFDLNKVEMTALFDAAGNLKEVESEIPKSALPKAVNETLARDYKDYKIEETAKIESKGVITYEAEVEKGEKSIDLIFDANGKLLKEIPKEKEDKE